MRKIYEEQLTAYIDFKKLGLLYKVNEGLWLPNALFNEGELNILDVYFRNTNVPAQFYIGLGNNGGTPGIPAETVTLASITHVSGTGYARQIVNRNTTDWSAPVLDSGDYQTTSKKVTFEAGGPWTVADYAFLATTIDNTGLLISAVALGQSYTLANGEGLNVTIKQKGK